MSIEADLMGFVLSDLAHGAVEKIDPADDLIENGVLDSFGIVELLGFIDTTLGVNLPPDEIVPDNFRTIQSLAALIEKFRSS